jgi:hypothetical protein
MTIWGRRDSEAPDEETELPAEGANESHTEAREGQAEAYDAQESAAEHQAGEPAPAFWRAPGELPRRDPADAPPPEYGHVPPAGPAASADGEQASGDAPAPAMNEAPAGTDAQVPVLTGVVIDAETEVKDPVSAGMPEDQAGIHDPEAGIHDPEAGGPEATEVQEPAVAVAREPVMTEAQEPVVTEPSGAAQEPSVTEAQEPVVTEPSGEAKEPAAAAVSPQRWSEILVAFVDDPRGSVKMAADAVDEAVDEFVNSVRARQRDLAATWQGAGADTEQLRSALREYRKLGQRVEQLDLGEKTGG